MEFRRVHFRSRTAFGARTTSSAATFSQRLGSDACEPSCRVSARVAVDGRSRSMSRALHCLSDARLSPRFRTHIGPRGQARPLCSPLLGPVGRLCRSEEHTSELQSLMRISYAVFCLKKKTTKINNTKP